MKIVKLREIIQLGMYKEHIIIKYNSYLKYIMTVYMWSYRITTFRGPSSLGH